MATWRLRILLLCFTLMFSIEGCKGQVASNDQPLVRGVCGDADGQLGDVRLRYMRAAHNPHNVPRLFWG